MVCFSCFNLPVLCLLYWGASMATSCITAEVPDSNIYIGMNCVMKGNECRIRQNDFISKKIQFAIMCSNPTINQYEGGVKTISEGQFFMFSIFS